MTTPKDHSEAEELLPCPWCGSKPICELIELDVTLYEDWAARCNTPNCPGNAYLTLDEWNTRQNPEVERLTKQLKGADIMVSDKNKEIHHLKQVIEAAEKNRSKIFSVCECVYEYTDKDVKFGATFGCQWTQLSGDLYSYNNCRYCGGIGIIRKSPPNPVEPAPPKNRERL